VRQQDEELKVLRKLDNHYPLQPLLENPDELLELL